MKRMKLAVIFIGTFFAAAALAEGEPHLKVTTTVQKEELMVSQNGEEKRELVEAASVVPGDSVVYTITFENVSAESAENVTITNPVPVNLTYEVGSAFGPGTVIQFSVDGGKEYGTADELTVTNNGEVRKAGPEDYTHIRWVMKSDLEAGAQGVARFRARLN